MRDLLYWLQFIAGRRGGVHALKPRVVVVCTHPDAAVEDNCTLSVEGYTSQWASLNETPIQNQFASVLDMHHPWLVLNAQKEPTSLRGLLPLLHQTIVAGLPPTPTLCVKAIEQLDQLRLHHPASIIFVDDFFQSLALVERAEVGGVGIEAFKASLHSALLR